MTRTITEESCLPSLRCLGIVGSFLVAWPHCIAAAAPAPPAEDLAIATIRSLGLQVDLPREQQLPDFSLNLPDVVLWVLVVVALAALLYWLKDQRWLAGSGRDAPAAQHADPAARQGSRLARAEYFAQQGAFVDAMHELLLEGFREIRERAQERLADSLTSREILRATPLPEPGRAALRAIIMRVEWTYFGEHAATLADYRACRESFDALHAALGQAASA
jgi:hypothetical protein